MAALKFMEFDEGLSSHPILSESGFPDLRLFGWAARTPRGARSKAITNCRCHCQLSQSWIIGGHRRDRRVAWKRSSVCMSLQICRWRQERPPRPGAATAVPDRLYLSSQEILSNLNWRMAVVTATARLERYKRSPSPPLRITSSTCLTSATRIFRPTFNGCCPNTRKALIAKPSTTPTRLTPAKRVEKNPPIGLPGRR